jgi:hypothetical protein
MTAASPGNRRGSRDDARVLTVGLVAWLVATVVWWPAVASFADEVGYLGGARIVLDGRLTPAAGDVGIWLPAAARSVPKYPLMPSVLLAPLLAVWPKAVFALGIAAAIASSLLAAHVLRSWGRDPTWALLVVAHPTVVIIARTAMTDVPLCALALATWWAFRRDRLVLTVALCTVLCAVKVTGGIVAGLLLGGDLLRRLPALRRREPEAVRALVAAFAGLAAGAAVVVGGNELTTGTPWFAYEHGGIKPFSPAHFAATAPMQLLNVLVIPPLLVLGAVPYWRRRELGPLALICGFGGLMCFYFFVDGGRSRLETLILAPRLLLPVVVFLLIGYADLLADLTRRLAGGPVLRLFLVAASPASAVAIGVVHARWQRPAAAALAATERITREVGSDELGVTPEADKAAIVFPGRVQRFDRAGKPATVVLCSDRPASYRAAAPASSTLTCELPGYRPRFRDGGFTVLVRD